MNWKGISFTMVSSCPNIGFELETTISHVINNYACAIFNMALAIPTTVLNLALIIAILKSSARKEPSQILVLNLAFTDFGAGIFGMPTISITFLHLGIETDSCHFTYASFFLGKVLGIASLLSVSLIAVERYIYVFKPFVHDTKLTTKLTAVTLFCLWLVSIALAAFFSYFENAISNATAATLFLSVSVIIIYSYTKILLRTWRVRRQIQTEAARFEQHRVPEKERSLLLVGGFIIISFFVCYTLIFARPILKLFGIKSDVFHYTFCWEWTFAMANSLFNPLITCIFDPSMRKEVFKILTCRCKRGS